MIVYLLFNGICKKATPISLDIEKCVPSVGAYAEGTVDLPLWYKVLVLDSILVDCDRRTVFWSCEKFDVDIAKDGPEDGIDVEEIRTFFKDKEQMFQENNCVGLDPTLEEMFETAENIFDHLCPEIFNKEGNEPTFKDLVKILHVFILPHIGFQQNQQKIVHDVLDAIGKGHENIEILIAMDVQSMKNIEELLQRERRDLLTEDGVSNILNNSPGNKDFIKVILKHTEKEVRHLEETLSMLSDKITPLRNATDETNVSLLADTRAQRDKVSKEIEKISLAREELVNGLILQKHKVARSRPRKSVNLGADRITDKIKMYKTKSAEIENLHSEIKQRNNIKIRLSSVREAVSLTLKEIQVDGSSYGYNRKTGSLEIEAALFDPTRKPNGWTTLNEHVKACLYSNESDFKTKHDEFCMMFKESCRAMQERAKRDFPIQFGTPATGEHALPSGSSQSHQNEGMLFSTRWRFGSVSKEDCETLCKQISDHILNMADEIVTHVRRYGKNLRSLRSKVYICYEPLISQELMPVLCKLFEQIYRTQCQQLSIWIEKYAERELDSVNRTLKNLFPSFVESLVDRCSETSSSLWESFDRAWSFLLNRDGEALSDLPPQTTSQNTRFISAFENFYTMTQEEDTAMSIFSKLRHLTRAVQTAEKTFSELRARNGQNSIMCTDDILDILILLICRLGPKSLLKLFAHVDLILHLSPYFLQGSINEYSLVTLTAAFQHLFERQEMHENSVQKSGKEN